MVSIIIINYNYGRFLGAAIESALAQTWKNVEVLVVDDGSTDESPDVIARYAGRIIAIRKENGGQASAFNMGFRHSKGQLVILLDADDMLYPGCVARVVPRYRPGISKLQYRLDTIDGAGRNLNFTFPFYPEILLPEEIKSRSITFGTYPWPVASGNVFARDFLAQALPIPDTFRNIADGYLSKLAPLYGDVETLHDILAAYRVHGANIWAQSNASGGKYAVSTGYELDMAKAFKEKATKLGYPIQDRLLLLNKSHLESRILSRRLSPDKHPVPGEPVTKLVWLGICSAWVAPDINIFGRLLWSLWFPTIGFMPKRALNYLLSQLRMQSFRASIAIILVNLSRRRLKESTVSRQTTARLSSRFSSSSDFSKQSARYPLPTKLGSTLVSIVITNHNYGNFINEAIDSALSQTWKNVEIIVVDDGSTDNSRDVITAQKGQIKAIYKENGGQTSAFNAGFQASTGDVVIFLDADDRLYPDCVERVMSVWSADTAKVQYRLNSIDAEGHDLRMPFPYYIRALREDVTEARRQLLRVGTYAWPGASGNAFSRAFLQTELPIPVQFKRAPDGLLNSLAPLYGPVVTMPDILADYRIHGDNVLAQQKLAPEKYAANVKYEMERRDYFRDRAHTLGYEIPKTIPLKNKKHIELRLLSLRLCPELHPLPADRARNLVWLGIRSIISAPDLNFFGRLMWILWFILLGILPRRALGFLVEHLRLQSRRASIARFILSLSRLSTALISLHAATRLISG